jgi:hypothetical protein
MVEANYLNLKLTTLERLWIFFNVFAKENVCIAAAEKNPGKNPGKSGKKIREKSSSGQELFCFQSPQG